MISAIINKTKKTRMMSFEDFQSLATNERKRFPWRKISGTLLTQSSTSLTVSTP
ncbi:hypothetical protein RND71_038625 [Anisodus tanguticus]|uniref:Uncharacterized protein n=1 Tax=Anisodus tanguticus TaxID=243964 RepID=A0AAE1QZE2_9SOLA|nr:hypothetical protein RND71_038625 [Anisodus tanguticus]